MPGTNIHVQAICGVNGGACCHANLLSRSKLSIKLVKDNSDSNDRLHESKLVPDTFSGTTAERDVPAASERVLHI